MRFAGKVKSLIGEMAEVEDLFDDNHKTLKVNVFKLKGKEILEGSIYEFMGEIEQNA